MRPVLVRSEGLFDGPDRARVSQKRSRYDDLSLSDCFGDAPKRCQQPQIDLVVPCLRD
jgi:hypothetical protein